MNYQQHTFFLVSINGLICTACSPVRAIQINPSIQGDPYFAALNYSPLFPANKVGGEQVPPGGDSEKSRSTQ